MSIKIETVHWSALQSRWSQISEGKRCNQLRSSGAMVAV